MAELENGEMDGESPSAESVQGDEGLEDSKEQVMLSRCLNVSGTSMKTGH